MKGCCSINKKQKITLACFLPVALAALFYAGGYLAQFIYNYQAWAAEGGTPYSGTSPPMPDAAFGVCLRFVLRFPYGLYGMGIFWRQSYCLSWRSCTWAPVETGNTIKPET